MLATFDITESFYLIYLGSSSDWIMFFSVFFQGGLCGDDTN